MFFRVCGFAVLSFFISTSASAETVWKIASLDWEPYSGYTMHSEGNSIQKLRHELRKHNIELLVEFYPWKRAQKKAASADFIGYFPAWPEEVYEGFIASPAIDWSQIAIMKMAVTELDYQSIDMLFKDKRVGIVSTYTYPEIIQRAINRNRFRVSSSLNEITLLKKLSAGRHDVAITDPIVMEYLAEKNSIEGIEVVETLQSNPLVIALRDHPDNQANIRLIEQIFSSNE